MSPLKNEIIELICAIILIATLLGCVFLAADSPHEKEKVYVPGHWEYVPEHINI